MKYLSILLLSSVVVGSCFAKKATTKPAPHKVEQTKTKPKQTKTEPTKVKQTKVVKTKKEQALVSKDTQDMSNLHARVQQLDTEYRELIGRTGLKKEFEFNEKNQSAWNNFNSWANNHIADIQKDKRIQELSPRWKELTLKTRQRTVLSDTEQRELEKLTRDMTIAQLDVFAKSDAKTANTLKTMLKNEESINTALNTKFRTEYERFQKKVALVELEIRQNQQNSPVKQAAKEPTKKEVTVS